MREQPSVGGDLAAEEFELQAAVELDSQILLLAVTPIGFSCHFGMKRVKFLVFKGVAQIACQGETTHLGNVGLLPFETDNHVCRVS